MPELSRFFGIIVRMYMEAGEPHHLPHLHAYYQDDVAVFTLDPVELIAGSLPRRQRRLVEAWGELHQGELEAASGWSTTASHRPAGMRRHDKMTHPIHVVKSFRIEGPYCLRVHFEDETEQLI